MGGFPGLKEESRALHVIAAVMGDPGLSQDLAAKPAGVILRLPVELDELRPGALDLDRVGGGAQADNRTAAVEGTKADLLLLLDPPPAPQ